MAAALWEGYRLRKTLRAFGKENIADVTCIRF